jgi:hypothetical protein
MLGSIVSHPSRRRKNKDGGIGTEEIEKRKRAQIDLPCSIDATHKGDRPWSNSTLQKGMKFRSS